MIRVLQVVGGLDRGGIETLLRNIYEHIDKNEFQFVFLCYGSRHFEYEEELAEMGAKIIRTDYPNIKVWKFIRSVKNIIKDNNIDIVHSNTFYNSAFIQLAAKQAGVKVRITHSHSSNDNKKQTFLRKIYAFVCRRMILSNSTAFAACSRESAEKLFGKNQAYKVIKNGVNFEKFKFDDKKRNKVRESFGIRKDWTFFGMIARQTVAKNPLFAIRVFYHYHKLNPKSFMVMVGKGEMREDIENEIEQLDLRQDIVIVEPNSKVHELYSAIDVLLLPSNYEGLPVVLIESQVSGLWSFVSSKVTEEALLTRRVVRLNLNLGAKIWAKRIFHTDLFVDRKEQNVPKSFEIAEVTLDLEDWYKQLLREGE